MLKLTSLTLLGIKQFSPHRSEQKCQGRKLFPFLPCFFFTRGQSLSLATLSSKDSIAVAAETCSLQHFPHSIAETVECKQDDNRSVGYILLFFLDDQQYQHPPPDIHEAQEHHIQHQLPLFSHLHWPPLSISVTSKPSSKYSVHIQQILP